MTCSGRRIQQFVPGVRDFFIHGVRRAWSVSRACGRTDGRTDGPISCHTYPHVVGRTDQFLAMEFSFSTPHRHYQTYLTSGKRSACHGILLPDPTQTLPNLPNEWQTLCMPWNSLSRLHTDTTKPT
ncbi:unnamed protein product [Laminaria digitata]